MCGPFLKSFLQSFCSLFWFFGCKAWGILVRQPGIVPAPAALKDKVLTSGLLGKSSTPHSGSLNFHGPGFSSVPIFQWYAGYLTIWISLYPASCYTIISWGIFFFFFFCLSLNFDSLSLKCDLFALTLNDGGLVTLTSPQFKSKCWVLTSHYFLNFRLMYLILCQIASPVIPDTTHLNLNSSWLSLDASSSVFFHLITPSSDQFLSTSALQLWHVKPNSRIILVLWSKDFLIPSPYYISYPS